MRFLLAPLLALCLISNVSAQVSQEDLFNSVCRVRSSDGNNAGIGSGFVFADNETTSYIMTCYHVVEENPTTVQFQRDGFMSDAIPVDVVFKSYDPGKRDLAILALDKSKLGKNIPTVLPLAGERAVNFGEHKMFTLGHPNGSTNPTMFIGTITSQDAGLHFSPPPASGRSGSPIVGILPSTGEYRAIGVIGWHNEETHLGRAMNLVQIYKILRGEEVKLGIPLNGYVGSPVQYFQECPPGGCPPPFKNPFARKPPIQPSQANVNPNNPWISTSPDLTLPPPPDPFSDYEKRIKALESGIKSVNTKVDSVLITAESVKDQLSKLGVTFDTKLKNYATRDSFGKYVTQTDFVENSERIVSSMTAGITEVVTEKIDNVETGLNAVRSEAKAQNAANSDKQSAFDAKLEKVAVVAGKVAPLLNFIPGWGTIGSLGVGGIATGLYTFSRRKKKNPTVVTQGVAPSVYPPAQPVNSDQPAQLDPEAILNLIREEAKNLAPAPQEHFTAPVPTFNAQPPATVADINYTVAPSNQDLLHWRRTMEAVSKKYPETGHAIKLIERAFPIYKSGVENGR